MTVLYSTEVELRKGTIMVPPISMYHLRKLLELKDKGIDLDVPDSKGLMEIISLLLEVIQENHPELTYDEFEKNLDAAGMQRVITAIQGLPKNSTAQAGMTTPVESQTENQEKKS